MAYALIIAVTAHGPAIAFILAVHRDGSPFRRSFWTTGEEN